MEIQTWLNNHNWTNAEGASKLGVSERTLYRWLTGLYPRDLHLRMQYVDTGETPAKAAPKIQYCIMLPAKGSGKHEMHGQKTNMTPDEIRAWKREHGLDWIEGSDGIVATWKGK